MHFILFVMGLHGRKCMGEGYSIVVCINSLEENWRPVWTNPSLIEIYSLD